MHSIPRPLVVGLLAAAAALAGGPIAVTFARSPAVPPVADAAAKAEAEQTAGSIAVADQPKAVEAEKKPKDLKKADPVKKADDPPECIQCGATCGLIPFCKCEPSTKKKCKTIYDSRCELVCVPGCGCPSHGRHQRAGCTACEQSCGKMRVREKKTLLKTVKEEEVDTVKHTVAYICECCAGLRGSSSCTGPHDRCHEGHSHGSILSWLFHWGG